MPEKRQFRHESLQDKRAIVKYLQAVKEGFDTGSLRMSDKEGEIVVEPNGLVQFELHANRSRDRVAMTLRFTWKERAEEEPSSGTLRINGEDQS